VLFQTLVLFFFFQKKHRLATANKLAGAGVENFNNVAADIALVDLV